MSRRREMGETNEWSSLGEEQRPKFYQIIHNSIIQDGSFELPAKFVKKIEKDLVDDGVAILKVPSGVEWRVKMIREPNSDNGGGVWLRTGIGRFIDCYSISAGHFLVFRYDGNSQFHVVIFNMMGSEIEYQPFEDNSNDGSEDDYSNDVDSMECFEIDDSQDDVDYAETMNGSPPDRDESDEDDGEDEVAKKPSKLAGSSRKNRSLSSNAQQHVSRANKIESSFSSTSRYPFFRIVMQTSYVERKYLPIPWAFTRYFPEELEDVKVNAASDRRSWRVGIFRSKTDLRLSKGVTGFMSKKHGLNLKVGDVLIFEIVKNRYLVLRVHVYPAADINART